MVDRLVPASGAKVTLACVCNNLLLSDVVIQTLTASLARTIVGSAAAPADERSFLQENKTAQHRSAQPDKDMFLFIGQIDNIWFLV